MGMRPFAASASIDRLNFFAYSERQCEIAGEIDYQVCKNIQRSGEGLSPNSHHPTDNFCIRCWTREFLTGILGELLPCGTVVDVGDANTDGGAGCPCRSGCGRL